jgi:hypothetical protein
MKTFNLNYLVSVKYTPKTESIFEYVDGRKKTFWLPEIPTGWFPWGKWRFYDKISEEELKEKFLIEEGILYSKPKVKLRFIDGSEKQINFDSEKEALHYFNIYKSSIPNPLNFEKD